MSRSASQSAASRISGSRSNGPTTPQGKATSSQNSRRHGFCSASPLHPGDNADEFEALRESYVQRFQPRDVVAQHYVDQAVDAEWRLRKVRALQAQLLDSLDSLIAHTPQLQLLLRYEAQFTRQYDRALKALHEIHAAHQAAKQTAFRAKDEMVANEVHRFLKDLNSVPLGFVPQTPADLARSHRENGL